MGSGSFRTSETCNSRKEAIAQGARFYWGPLCRYGHGEDESRRYATNTNCVQCRALTARNSHPVYVYAKKKDRRLGDDPGKHALDNHLRAQDDGVIKDVWDE